ncbi:SurA N-terminal domain-containing protein [uncultured Desulfosarcina sp.]|uniref:SurA N-terminal domain-containing protein n=1 Tax=uncultured Desulfosarcina sp. TaxID=218289 RepID=UPI0029C8EA02|nr:SurA N-terminal domain-containing protein [uncultured Desulfosarcina sp.]
MRKIFTRFAISYKRARFWPAPWQPSGAAGAHWIILGLLLLTVAACGQTDNASPHEAVLIRSDKQTVTRAQFERAFEAARIAYSDERYVDPRVIANARLRLLHQMAEELIVNRRAEELGITLDEAELDAAIEKIKQDYPENAFDEMLLESAIPYSLWKERLRERLLMEKVVDRELVQSLEVTAADIEAYYKAHGKDLADKTESSPEMDLERFIVEQLRRQKVEAAYPQWMEGLRQRYQVEIDWELWEQIQPSYARDKENTAG